MRSDIAFDHVTLQAITTDGYERDSKGFLPTRAEPGKWFGGRTASLYLSCCLVAAMSHANAEYPGNEAQNDALQRQSRLTTVQIAAFFSDVIDRGDVQDQRGIQAETHWYSDGRFVSRWWPQAPDNGDSVIRQVTGRWKAENNRRCVTFGPESQTNWSCAEVWLLDDGRILSLNPDGSPHGVHQISPLK
jgi:hypothetical protein